MGLTGTAASLILLGVQAVSKATLSLLGALLLLPPHALAGDRFASIARGIGKAAQRAGVTKVQILPLVSGSGEGTAEGRLVASRIMTELVEQGRVLIVEGDLPPGIPDPYGYAMGGKRRADIRLEAEAVVLGTHMAAGKRIHIDVKLLRVKDRVVLYSANEKVKNEWETELATEIFRSQAPEPREQVAIAAAPAAVGAAAPAERELDAPELMKAAWDSDDSRDCRQAAEEVDRLQSSILDIKARYIALRLRRAGSRPEDEPASLIQNGLMRDQFHAIVHEYLDGGGIPPLTRSETRTLLVVDGKSFEIHRRCLASS